MRGSDSSSLRSSKKQKVKSQAPAVALMDLPEAIRFKIFNYSTEDELMKLTRVSKLFSKIILSYNSNDDDEDDMNNGTRNFKITIFKKEFIPVITISPKIVDCVGNSIGKKFGKKYHKGKIASYNQQTQLYKVKYDDGDEEEMDDDDMVKYRLPKKQIIWRGHRCLASTHEVLRHIRKKVFLMNNSNNNNINNTETEAETETTYSKLSQDCRRMVVKHIDCFDAVTGATLYNSMTLMRNLMRNLQHVVEINGCKCTQHTFLHGIVSLDLSLKSPTVGVLSSLPRALSRILPKLQEINLSNTDIEIDVLKLVSKKCPHLETIIWNNNKVGDDPQRLYNEFYMSGGWARGVNNLKNIYMDNCDFLWTDFLQTNLNDMSNLNNHQEIFMFHVCCEALERVSIRNAKTYCDGRYRTYNDIPVAIPQNALIKFVLNAPPSLRWFRSDLTQENMTMLRLRRPGIELLN
jgi:hypothetical protein